MILLALFIGFIVLCAIAGVIAAIVVIVKPMSPAKARQILEKNARAQLAQEQALARVKAQQGL